MLEFYAQRGPKLMLDETSVFDIGACFVHGVDIAPGPAVPDDGDARIRHSVQGFLFTCGPDHIRHPEPIKGQNDEKYPLHGSFSASPAHVTLFELGDQMSQAEAEVLVTLAAGGRALLKRRWVIDGDSGVVALSDELSNIGAAPFAPMWMYHMNIGAKHFDEKVKLSGAMFEPSEMDWTFGAGDGHVFCVPAGKGQARLSLGPMAAVKNTTLHVGFDTAELPYLQMWRNQKRPAHVLGIEPVSHDWKSRGELAEDGAMGQLQPGEMRRYGLQFSFS
ncbi:DUF4432 family protein [Rhizobium sp. L1K21]|uniref:DUF4432 family protein n=1 Tax=Rhizobium sp. L1K21 TaxID=2954933 RepID=UPI002093BF04|nr:DUF4432 family protein [Rhizobium sp. L1K21]MCO6185609.1 DUF4432 family protein [Rhizobium sp. L1K21]